MQDYLMRAVRRKKDGKYFLACPNNDKEISILGNIDAWAGKGRKREKALNDLKEAMVQAPDKFFS